MEEKNKWRKKWLDRIKEIEKILHLPIEFKMWPEDGKPPENDKPGGGLWETMLWLPKALVVGWAIIFIIFSSFGISSFIYLSIVRF